MAQLFVPMQGEGPASPGIEWAVLSLDGGAVTLVPEARAIRVARGTAGGCPERGAFLLPVDAAPDGEWVLLAGRGVWRNGLPVVAGIALLRDRDELLAAGARALCPEPADLVPLLTTTS